MGQHEELLRLGLAPTDRNMWLSAARRIWRLLPPSCRRWFDNRVPYQKLTYGGWTLAWGRDRRAAYRTIFPSPPLGKTILDVGCNAGAYCFMAIEDGARFCRGIDLDSAHTARGISTLLRTGITNLEILTQDAFNYTGEPFDIVLCLNVLQHLGTTERVDCLVERLAEMARERLIMICPLTDCPTARYEYTRRGNVPYVLLSHEYFQTKYQFKQIDFAPLDAGLYGPNRGLITLWTNGR